MSLGSFFHGLADWRCVVAHCLSKKIVGMVVPLAVLSTLSHAEDAPRRSALIEEIVVSAQKRDESMQDVGIAVSAFSGAQIRELGFAEAIDIVAQTPGLTVARPGAGAINIFSIRGATQSDFAAVHESPVAVYVDEAYISQNVVTNFGLYDVERVEVLRGPQGTLFGRNATGGLLHFVTVKPSQEIEAFGEAQVAAQGRRRLEGAIGGGLAEGVAVRVSGVWNESDGLMKNRIGRDGQAADDWSIRGQILFEPTETFSAWLKAQYSEDDSDRGNYFHRVAFDGAFAPAPATDFFGYRDPDEGNIWSGAWDFDGFKKAEVTQVTLKLDWQLGDFDVTYVGDYQDIEHAYAEDSDVSPANIFHYSQAEDVQQHSHELRFGWQSDRMRSLVGAYYLNIDGDYIQDSDFFGQTDFDWSEAFFGIPEPGGIRIFSDAAQKTRTWALFGQLDFMLTDQVTLVTGLRYTRDKKSFRFGQAWLDAQGLFLFFENALPGDVPYFDFQGRSKSGDWSGKLQLEFRPDNGRLFYFGVNRGIKSGGFNAPVDATGLLGVNEFEQFIPFDQDDGAMSYDGEVVTSFEAGFKLSLFDGLARLNGSAFYYDYDDHQVYNLVGLTQTVFNSSADMWGFELEFAASPVDGLDLLLGVASLDSDVGLPPGVRPDGGVKSRAVLAPKWAFNGVLRYGWQLPGGGNLAVQTDFAWRDDQIFNLSNVPVVAESSYLVANASLGFSGANDSFYARAFVNNVFDKAYREYAFDTTKDFGSVEGVPGLRRWYGITVGYRM